MNIKKQEDIQDRVNNSEEGSWKDLIEND